jgi:hypothetical protein
MAAMSLVGPEGRKQLKLAARFAATGFELAMSVLVGYFGGDWLGRKFDLPYLWILGLALGVFAGFRSLYRTAKFAQEEASKTRDEATDKQDPDA